MLCSKGTREIDLPESLFQNCVYTIDAFAPLKEGSGTLTQKHFTWMPANGAMELTQSTRHSTASIIIYVKSQKSKTRESTYRSGRQARPSRCHTVLFLAFRWLSLFLIERLLRAQRWIACSVYVILSKHDWVSLSSDFCLWKWLNVFRQQYFILSVIYKRYCTFYFLDT